MGGEQDVLCTDSVTRVDDNVYAIAVWFDGAGSGITVNATAPTNNSCGQAVDETHRVELGLVWEEQRGRAESTDHDRITSGAMTLYTGTCRCLELTSYEIVASRGDGRINNEQTVPNCKVAIDLVVLHDFTNPFDSISMLSCGCSGNLGPEVRIKRKVSLVEGCHKVCCGAGCLSRSKRTSLNNQDITSA